MNRTTLTPALAAYAAGRTIAPLWISPSGRAYYPIAGGSQDPDPKPDPAPDPKPDPKPDPAPDPKPKPDPEPPAKGFPENTPVAEMRPAEQAAYWQHQAKKHEDRNKTLLGITGGKYGDDLKADLDQLAELKKQSMTDAEKAVEDAKAATRAELGPVRVRDAFELLLGDLDEQEMNDQLDLLDMSKFLTDSGNVDTAKVRTFAQKIAPSDKGAGKDGRNPDYGQGWRSSAVSASGISAGRDRYRERHGKSAKDD